MLADKAYCGHALRKELKKYKIAIPKKMKKWRQMVVHTSIVMPTAIGTLLSGALHRYTL